MFRRIRHTNILFYQFKELSLIHISEADYEQFIFADFITVAGIIFRSISSIPVSYTHLDVYKRQLLKLAPE